MSYFPLDYFPSDQPPIVTWPVEGGTAHATFAGRIASVQVEVGRVSLEATIQAPDEAQARELAEDVARRLVPAVKEGSMRAEAAVARLGTAVAACQRVIEALAAGQPELARHKAIALRQYLEDQAMRAADPEEDDE